MATIHAIRSLNGTPLRDGEPARRAFDAADVLRSGELTHEQFQHFLRTAKHLNAPEDTHSLWLRLRTAPAGSGDNDGVVLWESLSEWLHSNTGETPAVPLPETLGDTPPSPRSHRHLKFAPGVVDNEKSHGTSADPDCVSFNCSSTQDPLSTANSGRGSPRLPTFATAARRFSNHPHRRSPPPMTGPATHAFETALKRFFEEYGQKLAEAGGSSGVGELQSTWQSIQERGIEGLLTDIARHSCRNPDLPSHVILQNIAHRGFGDAMSTSTVLLAPHEEGGEERRKRKSQANTLSFASGLAVEHVKRAAGAHWTLDVALLFVDITGYSKVANTLSGESPYLLSTLVNQYFDRILRVITLCGGDTVKFAGDALLAVWHNPDATFQDNVRAAALCALQIMSCVGEFPIPNTALSFGLHIGLASGSVVSRIFTPPRLADDTTMPQCFHFIHGEPMKFVTEACGIARRGQVVLPAASVAAAGDGFLEVAPVDGHPGFAYLTGASLPPSVTDVGRGRADSGADMSQSAERYPYPLSPKRKLKGQTDAIEHSFIPPRVAQQILGGVDQFFMAQMRELVVLFICFGGDACDEAVWFTEVHGVMSEHGCSVLQVSHDDKGTHIVAAFNLYLMEHHSADSAVDLALTLRAKHSDSYVGIAAGKVLCGAIGSRLACQWDITGQPCVRACRLMQYAVKEGLVAVMDDSVYKAAVDHSVLRALDPISVKGSEEPVPVYVLKPVPEGREPAPSEIDRVPRLHFSHALCPHVHEELIALLQRTVGIARSKQGLAQVQTPAQTPGSAPMSLASRLSSVSGMTRTVVLKGAVGTGKFSLVLNAIRGTPFVPLVHTAAERDKRRALALVGTIATWFGSSIDVEVQAAAKAVSKALARGHSNDGFNLAVALVRLVREQDINVALIVRRAQFLDESSVSFLATINRELHDHPRCNWITFVCCYPLCGRDHPERVFESFQALRVVSVEEITEEEANALFCHTIRSKADPALGRFVARKAAHFAQFVVELGQYLMRAGALTVTANGQAALRHGHQRELERTSWAEISPALTMKTIHLLDRLTPQLLIMAKIVCAVTEQPGISAFFYSVNRVTQVMQDAEFRVDDVKRLHDLWALRLCEHKCTAHTGTGELDAAVFYMPPMRDIVSGILVPQQRTEINTICGDVYGDTHPMNHPMQFLVRARHFLFAERMADYAADIRRGWLMIHTHTALSDEARAALRETYLEWMRQVPQDELLDFVAPEFIKRIASTGRLNMSATNATAAVATDLMLKLHDVDATPRPLEMGPAREFLRDVLRSLRAFVECAEDSAASDEGGDEPSSRAASVVGGQPTVPRAVVARLKDSLADYVLVLQLTQSAPRIDLTLEQARHQQRIAAVDVVSVLQEAVDTFNDAVTLHHLALPPSGPTIRLAIGIAERTVDGLARHVAEDIPELCRRLMQRGAGLSLRAGQQTAAEVINKALQPSNVGYHVDLAELLREQRGQRDSVLHALELLRHEDPDRDKNIAVLLYEHLPRIVAVHCGPSSRLQLSFSEGLKEFYHGLLEPAEVHTVVRASFVTFLSLWIQCCRQASLFQ